MIIIEKDINFTVLENGLDFILSATANIIYSYDKFSVKYGVLHMSSGLELIFKSKIIEEDWKQVFQNVDKADEKLFKSGNFQSVNSKTCEKRLEEVFNVNFSQDEKEILKIIREKRNRLEHLSIIDSSNSLKAYLVKFLNLVINFISNNFKMSEMNAEEIKLLDEIRIRLGQFEEFVEHRWNEIYEKVKLYSQYNTTFVCPSCYEKALITDDGAKCLFCGYSEESRKVAQKYIDEILNINEYEMVTQGGEYPLYECKECGSESFIYDDNLKIYKCINCSQEASESETFNCDDCGQPYIVFDFDEDIGLCGDCLDLAYEKY